MTRSLDSASEQETTAVGAQLAASLRGGSVVFVSGDLGAGKTTLIRGAAAALGVSAHVTSPTFAIAHRYPARGGLAVAHLDLYRLGDLAGEESDVFADYVGEDLVTFIEWPAGAEGLLCEPSVRVELLHVDSTRRRITIWE